MCYTLYIFGLIETYAYTASQKYLSTNKNLLLILEMLNLIKQVKRHHYFYLFY